MSQEDGSLPLELQAYKVAQSATMYKGSRPCPSCGYILNPIEYMYNGICNQCQNERAAQRVKGRMA